MRIARRDEWRPTELAEMLWLIVVAMLLGWLVVLLLGHPVDVMP